MTFEERRSAALTMLQLTGIWRSHYSPPLLRLLWRLGIKVPPPHFVSFATNFAVAGLWFGVLWGLFMWFIFWSHQGVPLTRAMAITALAGLLFGLFMASYYRYGARKHGLPKWKDISASGSPRSST